MKAVEQFSLEPCPFCGIEDGFKYLVLHEPEEVEKGKYLSTIECQRCWAMVRLSRPDSDPRDSALNVVKTWNDRSDVL